MEVEHTRVQVLRWRGREGRRGDGRREKERGERTREGEKDRTKGKVTREERGKAGEIEGRRDKGEGGVGRREETLPRLRSLRMDLLCLCSKTSPSGKKERFQLIHHSRQFIILIFVLSFGIKL